MTVRPAYRNHRFPGENSPKISASRTTVPEKTSVRQHIEHLRRGICGFVGSFFGGGPSIQGPKPLKLRRRVAAPDPTNPEIQSGSFLEHAPATEEPQKQAIFA